MKQTPTRSSLTAPEAARRLAELETRLQELEADLRHSGQLATIGLLTAGIAHEVNNLLTPVIAYAQLAHSRPEDHELARKCIERTRVSGDATAQILQAILDFARPDSADEPPYTEVSAAIDAAVHCLGRDLATDHIDLRLSVEPGLAVAMPRRALQQVLVNLLANSQRELRDRQGGMIQVDGHTDGDRVTLVVSDDGPGFPPQLVSTLFDPFVTGSPDGSGLGLKLVRDAVVQAGGTIVAGSPGPGAVFRMNLPGAPRCGADRRA